MFDYPCRMTASQHACVRMQSICRHTHRGWPAIYGKAFSPAHVSCCHSLTFFTSCRPPGPPPAKLITVLESLQRNEYNDIRLPRCRRTNANGTAVSDPASLTDPFVILYGCLYSYHRNSHDSKTASAHCYMQHSQPNRPAS